MKDEEPSLWIRIKNLFHGLLEVLDMIFYGVPMLILTFFVGVLVTGFKFLIEAINYFRNIK